MVHKLSENFLDPLKADRFLATIHSTPEAMTARIRLDGSGTITGANAR
jgi:hypothetical protein